MEEIENVPERLVKAKQMEKLERVENTKKLSDNSSIKTYSFFKLTRSDAKNDHLEEDARPRMDQELCRLCDKFKEKVQHLFCRMPKSSRYRIC